MSNFQPTHTQEFALEIHERAPNGQVVAVMCLFCKYLRREEVDPASRKRARTENQKLFTPKFRPELYRAPTMRPSTPGRGKNTRGRRQKRSAASSTT